MVRRTFLLAVFSFFALAACGDDDATGPGSSITGTYQLQTVNGQPLPYTIFDFGANKVEATQATLTLNENRTFNGAVTLRRTENGAVRTETVTESGSYTQTDNTIQFTFLNNTATGVVSGNSLTVNTSGAVLVYQK